jgi:thiol:disulfide interchange protein
MSGHYTRQFRCHRNTSMQIAIRSLLSLIALLGTFSTLAQSDGLAAGSGSLSLDNASLLRVEQAFSAQALIEDGAVEMVWTIAPGYYLYRKQFRVLEEGTELAEVQFEQGETTYDPFFDEEVEVYRYETALEFSAPEARRIEVRFQGCADAGYCYPPSWVAFEVNADRTEVTNAGLIAGPSQGQPSEEPASSEMFLSVLGTFAVSLALGLAGWQLIRRRKNRV